MYRYHMISLGFGFLLDVCFGDPEWLPHPVQAIGALISFCERILRAVFPKTKKGERVAGSVLVFLVFVFSMGLPFFLLWITYTKNVFAGIVLEGIFCYQLLAMKGLKTESEKVRYVLENNSLEAARQQVSRIVGRDTNALSKDGVIKAAVETVAENTSDGVIAPLFWMGIGGAAFGFFYKAVNTMDSMLGYKNEKYLNFGRTAAKLDDIVNLLPSRLAAIMMIFASFLLQYRTKEAVLIYRRDRFNHASPNSAQTESVCAGALGIQLAGNAYYFGTLYEKPTIGDDNRPIETEDIRRANQLLYVTGFLTMEILLLTAVFCW